MDEMIVMTIPFPGFYETDLTSSLDYEEEQYAETLVEEGQAYGLTEREVRDAIYWEAEYGRAFLYIVKEYAEAFAQWLNENLLLDGEAPYTLAFESMTSPREYNFTTDRVFVTLPINDFLRMCAQLDRDVLDAVIAERFTSRDGFISWYSNDSRDWFDKPLAEWDHNEAGTALLAFLRTRGREERETEREVVYALQDRGVFSYAFEEMLDFAALDARLRGEAEQKGEAAEA